jgi:FkbM family methyltransferase
VKPAVSDPPEVHRQLWEGFTGEVGYDIGANCGQTLGEMISRFTEVYAFEPAQECWPYLQDQGVNLMQVAISDNNDGVDLVELPDKIDTGQLVTAGTVGMEWDPDDEGAIVRHVPSNSIDYLTQVAGLPMPDFMKIDVEGHELKVLFGARQVLATRRPDLLIEFHSPELHEQCRDLLLAYDYDVFTIRHPHYRPGTSLWFTHGWLRATQ